MIPNMISLINMLFGFSSMVFAFHGLFGHAASAIMLATILDLFDGRIARLMKNPSPLGEYLDAFADIVSFCIAPGILFFCALWGSKNLYPELKTMWFFNNKWIGIIISFIFPLIGATRLARFEVFQKEDKKNFFIGLPSTFAAAVFALYISFPKIPNLMDPIIRKYIINPDKLYFPFYIIIPLFLFFSYLMISRFKIERASKEFLNFYPGITKLKILLNVIFIITVVLFTKYFLIIAGTYIILKPVITWKKVDKSEIPYLQK